MYNRRITIIRPDNTVLIDGKARALDCSGMDPAISVVQWTGTSGHIEYVQQDDQPFVANAPIANLAEFKALVDEWDLRESNPRPPPEPDLRVEAFKTDAARVDMYDRLTSATPQQIDDWVNANMTNLAQARAVFAALLKVLATRL